MMDSLLKEHATPQHLSREQLAARLPEVLRIGHDAMKQLVEFEALAATEELAAPTELQPTFEHIHQALAAAKARAKAFTDAGRELHRDFIQIADVLAKTKAGIDRVLAETQQGAKS